MLLDPKENRYVQHNSDRCARRVTPISTLKIPNSLINVELGIVRDAAQVTKWDGVDRGNPDWNHDQTLASAFSVSALWYYQSLARQLGDTRMRSWVHKLHYGNEDTAGGIDRFWLESSLTISPNEHVEFLRRLVMGELPFSPRTVAIVKNTMIVSREAILRTMQLLPSR